jgi:hypothetical protein
MASGYEKAECGVDPNEGWGSSKSPKLKSSDIFIALLAWISVVANTFVAVFNLFKLFAGS